MSEEVRKWQQEDSQNRLVIGVGMHVWSLMQNDPEEFKRRVREHVTLCYPGYKVVKARRPDIYLIKERGESLVR